MGGGITTELPVKRDVERRTTSCALRGTFFVMQQGKAHSRRLLGTRAAIQYGPAMHCGTRPA